MSLKEDIFNVALWGKNNQVFRKDSNDYIFWSLNTEFIYLHFIYIYLQNVWGLKVSREGSITFLKS